MVSDNVELTLLVSDPLISLVTSGAFELMEVTGEVLVVMSAIVETIFVISGEKILVSLNCVSGTDEPGASELMDIAVEVIVEKAFAVSDEKILLSMICVSRTEEPGASELMKIVGDVVVVMSVIME